MLRVDCKKYLKMHGLKRPKFENKADTSDVGGEAEESGLKGMVEWNR